jgi:NAD-dependent dihydropyrimidine dehydrogenase PreA subunit
MEKRKIIKIDESLCNGCGDCVVDCEEGAIAIIDGKAKIIKESFCDGLGACIGSCPTGALKIVEREADAFTGPNPDTEEVHKKYGNPKEEKHGSGHGHGHGHGHEHNHKPASPCGCPGSAHKAFKKEKTTAAVQTDLGMGKVNQSDLEQWPVQLHLVNPEAPFFKNKELVVMSTCGPIASADVHWRYLRGRSVVVACPKLDITDPYVDKLAQIFREVSIPKVIVARMVVPCCGGLSHIAKAALDASGRKDLVVEEHVISLEGELQKINQL